jgi:hypothetical protein
MEPHDYKPKRLANAREQILKGLGCNDNVETILSLVTIMHKTEANLARSKHIGFLHRRKLRVVNL